MATIPGNAINETTTGIVGFTGTAFTGTAVTQYDVIVGGSTSSTLGNVGPGSAGQVLQSGGNAANPAYSTATYPSTAGTSGNVLTSDGTNWLSSAAPGGGLLVVSGNLTNTQIKNLHGTPVQIIAAPGSGKVIQVINGISTMNYGGNNAFTNGGVSALGLYYGTTLLALSFLVASQITSTSNQMYISVSAGTFAASTSFTNIAMNLYNPSATEWAGNAANDNTISYNVIYRIVTIP